MKKSKNKKKNKIKEVLIKLKNIIIANKCIIFMGIPFFLIDILTRIFGYKIKFYGILRPVPNLFTLCWIFLFVGLSYYLGKKKGKILYIIFFLIALFLYLLNNIYYSLTSSFFDFSLMLMVSEGSSYFMDAIVNCNILVYIMLIPIVFTFILALKYYPKVEKINIKKILKIIIIFIICHAIIPLFLGTSNSELAWNTWKKPKNIYLNFNDNNKSMKISGLYEYSIRNFYITFIKPKNKDNDEELTFLKDNYNSKNYSSKNNYTGIYENKNLIILQLEGIDNWLVTEEDTPTLYNMLNNGINFSNHYSYYNGGGSTFNSEFAVNTGFITPLSYTQNAYSFNKNYFPYSLAHLFKEKGYMVNAFHMNTSEYYSRGINYKNWGYDNYYGLKDLNVYNNNEYELDRELILNETFNTKLFENEKFVDYIITYSPHLPFTTEKGVCKMLVEEDIKKENNFEELPSDYLIPEYTEEECARRQAKETDYMIELLLNMLEEKDLLDNTVLVVFTDHYLYTLADQTILDKYKETSNNLINKTPFFIWTKDIITKEIKEVTSQLNILPTILNLFNINYNKDNYIGEDALDKNYKGYVFFSDYSWYDGKNYIEPTTIIDSTIKNYKYLEDKSYYINYQIKKNDLMLKYDYFKRISKKQNSEN